MAIKTETDIDIELNEPKKYLVYMINDDYTHGIFVSASSPRYFIKQLKKQMLSPMIFIPKVKVYVAFIVMRSPKQKQNKLEVKLVKRAFPCTV